MRILEIGAGTGSATEYMIDTLGTRSQEYLYTDISPSFFGKAQGRFKNPKMVFKTLDISQDLVN